MKILFVIAHLGKGGGQVTQSVHIMRELSKHHDTKLLTLKYDSNLVTEPCETEYAGKLSFPLGIYDLWRKVLAQKNDYDVVQCFDSFYALPAVWLSGARKFYLRLGLTAKAEFIKRGYSLIAPFADAMLFPLIFSSGFSVNSKSLQTDLKFYKPKLIKNGYNLEEFKSEFSKNELRTKLGIPANKFVLLYTGKIIEGKNLEPLLKVARKINNSVLVLVGNSNEEYYGSKYINELKKDYKDVFEKAIMAGEVPMNKVKDYLNCSDCFVFPSSIEGSPNSVIEAMACSLPAVCSDIASHTELIQDKKNGFIFKSVEDLQKIILKIQANKTLSKKIGNNARKYVEENHNIKKIAKKYIEMYNGN